MKISPSIFNLLFLVLLFTVSCKKDASVVPGEIGLSTCSIGDKQLMNGALTTEIPINLPVIIKFSVAVNQTSVNSSIYLKDNTGAIVPAVFFEYADSDHTVHLKHNANLQKLQQYTLVISPSLKGSQGETFRGAEYKFITTDASLTLKKITIDDRDFLLPAKVSNVPVSGAVFALEFSLPVDTVQVKLKFTLEGYAVFNVSFSSDLKSATLQCPVTLKGNKQYSFGISTSLKAANGYSFPGFTNTFTTVAAFDSTLKFPLITDEELLTLVQRQTFKYFYDFAHPASGMARERNSSGNTVTIGGSGFGVMAIIVGMDRGFITRNQGITHLTKIIHFLETCDRFHGVWPHWIDGNTGKVIPFSTLDNGGDLVETSFMIQGLITLKQYLNVSIPAEADLKTRILNLCNAVEYDWYTQGKNALYWHWSPTDGFAINMMLRGYNETLITYVVAATSTAHPITATAYHQGYANNGGIKNGNSYYGYKLPLGQPFGGPLFFTHYSFLGLNPHTLSDVYANYWEQNVNQSLISHAYCKANPKKFAGYNDFSWGLTASDNPWGYNAHSPTNDLGVITPTAAISSLPYSPVESMNAIRYFYFILGDKLWGEYGFYDAYCPTENWFADSYLAIDQGPEIVMIENYRTGLLWNLFMSAPEVQPGLTKLGFSYK